MKKNALVDNVLPPLVCISMLMALAAALLYAPTEKVMGDTQRIFYFHVPAAISAFVCFFLVFIGSVQYLRTRYAHWDRLALCAAELGVLFGLIVLVTGPHTSIVVHLSFERNVNVQCLISYAYAYYVHCWPSLIIF